MPVSSDPTDSFLRFMAAFPERDGGHDADAAREAWARAIGRGADPEAVLGGAEAYKITTEGRPRRYVLSARRWLDESRWRDAAPVSGPSAHVKAAALQAPAASMVWIPYGSPQWRAWSAFYRATRGKSPPQDVRGGWRFPSPWPPGAEQAA